MMLSTSLSLSSGVDGEMRSLFKPPRRGGSYSTGEGDGVIVSLFGSTDTTTSSREIASF